MTLSIKFPQLLQISALCISLLLIGGTDIRGYSNEEGMDSYREQKINLGVMKKEILAKSQISYRAQGEGPGLKSYGVIISCVEGNVSIMKTLDDPDLGEQTSKIRELGRLDPEVYMDLWAVLLQKGIWSLKDGPAPTESEPANFTVEFYASIADKTNKFSAKALYRPETADYLSVQSIIDKSVNMQSLWDSYHSLARK